MAQTHASDGGRLDRLAEEQAALRRVAAAAARGAEPSSLFALVAEQVSLVLHVPLVSIVRFEDERTATARASFPAHGGFFAAGKQWSLAGTSVLSETRASGGSARIDDYAGLRGEIAEEYRRVGIRSTVGIPVAVGGRTWGAMIVSSTDAEPLPADTEQRLADFTELLATAIANSEAQAEVARLAQEQAALRRVATLVAQGMPSDALFAAVCDEVEAVAGADVAIVLRFEADGTVTVMGTNATRDPVGARLELDPGFVVAEVHRTGRAARFDTDDPAAPGMPDVVRAGRVRSVLASPIVVESTLWGVIAAGSREGPVAASMERRLADFTELVATAIANSHARRQVKALADEQAALRRVATLVARERPEAEVLAVVADEVTRLFGGHVTQINRYGPDATATSVAAVGSAIPIGTRMTLEDDGITTRVFRTGRPARIDAYSKFAGWFADQAYRSGIKSVVAVPIVVDEHLWGVLATGLREPGNLPADLESRLAEFAALLATAISNLQARAELAASRARIAAAADDERRRVVRDLHDGAQQRMVNTAVTLKLAQQALAERTDDAPLLVHEAIEHAEQAMADLRELAHGILPAVLTHGGLRAGITALGSRTPIPVELDVSVDRLPAPVEATGYFVVAESLTNVAKHSSAGHAEVVARIEDGMLRVEVRDDGVGGASPDGSGLVGLADRLAVVDGRLEVDSPPGGGTRVAAAIPLARSGRPAGA